MRLDLYSVLTTVHIVSLIVLVGNVTITSFWKVLADWSKDVSTIAFAQRAVVIADWLFTVPAIVFLVISGYWLVILIGADPINDFWLLASQLLFVASGLIWLAILVPIQARQLKRARFMAAHGRVPPRYHRDANLWIAWGIAATVPLIAALYLMVAKPVG